MNNNTNKELEGWFSKVKSLAKKALVGVALMSIFATLVIVGYEQVDDRIEKKWRDLTVTEYVSANASTTVEITSDEERLIEKYKDSDEAQQLIEAWAKGKAADDMRERAEQLSQDARAVSMGFTQTDEL